MICLTTKLSNQNPLSHEVTKIAFTFKVLDHSGIWQSWDVLVTVSEMSSCSKDKNYFPLCFVACCLCGKLSVSSNNVAASIQWTRFKVDLMPFSASCCFHCLREVPNTLNASKKNAATRKKVVYAIILISANTHLDELRGSVVAAIGRTE